MKAFHGVRFVRDDTEFVVLAPDWWNLGTWLNWWLSPVQARVTITFEDESKVNVRCIPESCYVF